MSSQPGGTPITNADRKHRLLLALLLIAGAAARFYGAWTTRHQLDPDSGIVALMAKHIAEGSDFPVFFYGQAYMGSFEPAVSALFVKLLGPRGLAISLGPALLGFLLLPVLYAWARDAAGRNAGLAALALSIVGHQTYFYHFGSSKGGYAAVLLLGSFVLWQSARIVADERAGQPAGAWRYLALGIAAGLGWWSTQLISAALIAAAILFLCGMGRRLLCRRLLAGPAGFVLGSLPFWAWNATHRWETMSIAESLGQVKFSEGLGKFFEYLSWDLVRRDWPSLSVQCAVYAVHVGAILLAARLLWKPLPAAEAEGKGTDCDARIRLRARAALAAAFLFLVLSILIFSRSFFALLGTTRYILPVVPPIAVILGAAAAALGHMLPRRAKLLAAGPVAAMLLVQWPVLGWALDESRGVERYWARHTSRVSAHLRTRGIRAAYVDYIHHWLNFSLGEEFTFCALPVERYAPYARQAELADNIAIMATHDSVPDFLLRTGGSASREKLGDFVAFSAFSPPQTGRLELPQNGWQVVVAGAADEAAARDLCDRRLDTGRAVPVSEGRPASLEIRFSQPVAVCGFRLVNEDVSKHPALCRIDGELDGQWQPLVRRVERSAYYWSGPRPYWSGPFFRYEVGFATRTLSALRIVCEAEEPDATWQVSELQVFAQAAPLAPESDSLPALLDVLTQRRIASLYCDRWVAARLHDRLQGRVAVPLDHEAFPHEPGGLPTTVRLEPRGALLARTEDAGLCKDVLAARGAVMRETPVGPWTLFDFGPGQWRESLAADRSMRWLGFGCLQTSQSAFDPRGRPR